MLTHNADYKDDRDHRDGMSGEGDLIQRVLCVFPTVNYLVWADPIPAKGGNRNEFLVAVCDVRLADDGLFLNLNQDWATKYNENARTATMRGFSQEKWRKILEQRMERMKSLEGLSIPYVDVKKVSGRKRGRFEMLRATGGPAFTKDGMPVPYDVRFEFNEGSHFWNKSYVEFKLTDAEYGTVRGILDGKPSLAGRLNLQ